jgi:hypothetical protein
MTLAEIRDQLEDISDGWPFGTADERKLDLVVLDDLLGELDDMDSDTAAEAERIDEVRGRIEILMDEIDISLGIEPAPIAGYDDPDPRTPDELNAWSKPGMVPGE